MNRDELDRALQEYLDDRLDGAGRSAFERQIAEDPELAARVEAGRALRRELRASSPELSPGFYARARARFEERRPVRPAWRRVLSLEAAGLAAAAVLIAALFLPPLLRDDGLDGFGVGPEWLDAEALDKHAPPGVGDKDVTGDAARKPSSAGADRPESARLQDSRERRAAERNELPVVAGRPAPVEREADALREDAGVRGELSVGVERQEARATPPPPGEGRSAPLRKAAARPAEGPVERPEGEDAAEEPVAPFVAQYKTEPSKQRAAEPSGDDASAPGTAAEDRSRDAVSAKATESDEAKKEARFPGAPRPAPSPVASVEPADREADELRATPLLRPAAAALPVGLLAANEIRVIENRAAWDAWLATGGDRAAPDPGRVGEHRANEKLASLRALAPDFTTQRVALLGPRSRPVDCANVLLHSAEQPRLVLAPAEPGSRAPSAGGCAVVIPAGSAGVSVMEHW